MKCFKPRSGPIYMNIRDNKVWKK